MTNKEIMEFRAQYELRVKKLEDDIFKYVRPLDRDTIIGKWKLEHKNDKDKEKVMSWKYDMKEFSLEEITLHQKGRSLHLRAYHKSGVKSLKVKNKIVLPEDVDDSKISSTLSPCGILTISVVLKTDIPEEAKR